ncbi:MAG: Mrr cat protein, partial [Acidobacteriota bacterium]|nr:Mrr cat protein [Acidobacteriota bacterium]
VSLSGFKESAIEQEKEAGNRVILMDRQRVIDELIRGNIIVSPLKAMECAVHCAAGHGENVKDLSSPTQAIHLSGLMNQTPTRRRRTNKCAEIWPLGILRVAAPRPFHGCANIDRAREKIYYIVLNFHFTFF